MSHEKQSVSYSSLIYSIDRQLIYKIKIVQYSELYTAYNILPQSIVINTIQVNLLDTVLILP